MSDLKEKTDEELMQAYQSGSEISFEVLFERYAARVLSFLSKRLIAKKAAEDLLQEVFFKLHRSKHLYNPTLPFSPWLFSVTRSVLLDSLKKKNLEDSVDPSDFNSVRAPEPAFEHDQGVYEVLSHLPEPQRQTIQMRVYDEKTFEEIASKLSTSPENARQLFSRGVKKIRQLLERKD